MMPDSDSIDLVFPTYWIYPPKVDVLNEDDMKCVKEEAAKLERKPNKGIIIHNNNNDNNGYNDKNILGGSETMDFDQLLGEIESDCLKRGKDKKLGGRIYETPSEYDPLSINMGQVMMIMIKMIVMMMLIVIMIMALVMMMMIVIMIMIIMSSWSSTGSPSAVSATRRSSRRVRSVALSCPTTGR